MELNNYRSANTPRKKKKKITASAAVVFCILSLVVGIVCGKSSSSGLDPRIMEMVSSIENYQETVDTYEAEIKTRKDELTKIYNEIGEAKKEQKALAQSTEEPVSNDDATESKNENVPKAEESSGSGILGKLIIGALVIVIIVCILFAASIFLKKNDSDNDDDDEYDDEDEYDEYYEEDEDSDEDYENDEEEYDDLDEDEE